MIVARRRPGANGVFWLAAIPATIALLGAGAGLTFFSDEWAFIERRSLGDPASWFAPHNEHWVTLPALAYRLLVETVGLGSYVPFHALLVATHVGVAWLVLRLVRARAGDLAGASAGVLVLLFGAGFENLLWAFQVTLVASTLFGLAAVAMLDRPRSGRTLLALAGLLLAALASSGIGLFFAVVVGTELALDALGRRRTWPDLVAVIAPLGVYLAWYLAIGRSGIGVHRDPFTIESVLALPAFVARGAGNGVGAVTGLGPELGGLAGLVIVGAAVLPGRGRGVPARFTAAVAGIVAAYALVGLTRAGVTPGQADYTRYTYVSGVLALVGVAALAGPAWQRAIAAVSPGSDGGRRRLAVLAAGAMVFVLALTWNVRLLVAGRALFLDRADVTRAFVTVALAPTLPAGTEPDRSLVLVPSPTSLREIAAAHGTPLGDSLVPWAVRPIPPEVLADATRRVREGVAIPGS